MLRGAPAPKPRFETLLAALVNAASTPLGITFVGLDERESTLSYAQLLQSSRAVAGALERLGVLPGDRVALILPTGASFPIAFFGALFAGAVPVPLYPPVRFGRLPEYHAQTARMLSAVQATVVLADAQVRRMLGQSVERARPPLGCHTVESLLERDGVPMERKVSGRALALVQFSSGSTVDPKPVALTHENLVSHCEAIRQLIPEEEPLSHRGVSWLPLYHDMGLIGFLLTGIYYPGALTLIAPEHFLAKPALWLKTLSRHRGTLSASPNFGYGLCLKRIKDEELEGVDLSSWAVAFNGAESVSPALVREFTERFKRFGFRASAVRPVYGLSEATLAVTFPPQRSVLKTRRVDAAQLALCGEVRELSRAPGSDSENSGQVREIASVGQPVPGVDIDIRDAHGASVGDDTLGRLFVRGPSVMQGYLGQPAPTPSVIQNGWLDTGDLGFSTGGELYIAGRAKDVVIIRGANHTPQTFEEYAGQVPGVRVGCVVALGFHPEDGASEELLILAERTAEAGPILEDEISRHVARHTGIRPHTVKLLEPGTLPRTSSGKLRRSEALGRYLSGNLMPPARLGAVLMAAEFVKSAFAFRRAERP